MFTDSFCCFCDGNDKDLALFAMMANQDEYKIFQENRPCEKCLNSLKEDRQNFSSQEFLDAINCFNEPQFFLPEIDNILLLRFAKTLVGFEKYSFAFSSNSALSMIQLKPLIVTKNMIIDAENRFIPYFENSNILVTEKFEISYIKYGITKCNYKKVFNSIYSKQLFIKAKFVELCELEISSNNFFQLLSPQLNDLKCFKVELTTLLNPITFIQKLPNIKNFLFSDINDIFPWILKLTDNSAESLLPESQYKNLPIDCKTLKEYCVSFQRLNLKLKSFSDITKEWTMSQTKILLALYDLESEIFSNGYPDISAKTMYDLLTEEE